VAVTDKWKAFEKWMSAVDAAILSDKFHVIGHLGDTLDKVRKMEYFLAIRKGLSLNQGAEVHPFIEP
jgi:hypothetical protein